MFNRAATFGNEYMGILADVSQLHRTSRQKYLELFRLLQKKGVKFEHIRSFLINEAKRCHLHRKCIYNPETSKMRYKTQAELRKGKVEWFVQLENFHKWVKRNYLSYDKEQDTVSRTSIKVKEKTIIHRRKETSSTEVKDITKEEMKALLLANISSFQTLCESIGATKEFESILRKLQ